MASRRQEEPQNWAFQLLERHGISAFLLIVGGYYVLHTVVEPMVKSAQTFVADIRMVNQEMEKAYLQAQAENLERWSQVWDILEMKKRLVETVLEKIDRLERSNDKIAQEAERLRLLLTKPEVEARP